MYWTDGTGVEPSLAACTLPSPSVDNPACTQTYVEEVAAKRAFSNTREAAAGQLLVEGYPLLHAVPCRALSS